MARLYFLACVLAILACAAARAQEPVIQTSQALNDRWFTGPLLAPALPKAGLFVI